MRVIGAFLAAAACFRAAAAAPANGVSRDLAVWRAGIVSEVRYRLSFDIKAKAEKLHGHESLEFRLSRAPEEALPLDFRDLSGPGAIADLKINGSPLRPEQPNGHILLPAIALKAGVNQVEMDFESPVAESNRAITRSIDPVDSAEYLYTLFVPMDASMAFPCFDQPDLKARFTLETTAPEEWTVISNTSGRTDHGRTRFEETHPISTYLFAFAAGPFAQLPDPDPGAGGPPLRLFVRRSMVEKAKQEWPEVARYTHQGMKQLSGFFDQPYPFPKYDQVLIPGFPYGGMEHAGATFLREDGVLFRQAPSITDHQRRSVTVLHELSHQWFGDFVTMRWFDDLWLKEGFAQFMAFHTLAQIEPPAEVWKRFYESIKPIAYGIDSTPGTTPIYQVVPNLADAKSAYGPIVYQKAPSLLRVLNYRIGEDAFRTGVRSFLKSHAYSNATWQDLIGAFSDASKQDLKSWANAWVTQRGMPVVTVKWACSGQLIRDLELSQRDSLSQGHLWPISTEVALGAGRVVDVSFGGASTKVAAAAGRPCPAYVFANAGDHAYGRFLLDDHSISGVEENLATVADPLERALLWGALWDAVREADLPPVAYLDLAMRRLPAESDIDITQSVLGRCRIALTTWMSSAQRGTEMPRFESLLRDRMKTAGSVDFRIAYFRAFTATAATAESLSELQNLLDGRSQVPGVPLQQRDRWNIIASLVRHGAPDATALVEAEAARDKTEDGRRSAYAALAGVATGANKRKYFDDYLKEGAAPEDFITASLPNFNAWNQTDLTLGYLKPALEALPLLKKQRKIFFVNAWLASFVSGQTSHAAQKTVADFLVRTNLDADLRLKVLEVKDDLNRTIRIRARWR
ncbi:MAG TPA: M1 family aminopeptidase [Bryobacteraceae bacterium]|nr:M1 family aminopeptidase [Bryobacteraceae bacterium]